jgi:AcrR family transcriptional regulator
MPKLGMEPIRRRQLIEATYEVLRREGFANTTLAKIAAEAGLQIPTEAGRDSDLKPATVPT